MTVTRALLLTLAVSTTVCGPDPSPRLDLEQYAPLLRTGYFEGSQDPGDWRTSRISGEDARRDILVLDSLMKTRYAYNEAELTDTTERLIPTLNPPGFQNTISYIDGEDGDRLPGSPEHQGSIFPFSLRRHFSPHNGRSGMEA